MTRYSIPQRKPKRAPRIDFNEQVQEQVIKTLTMGASRNMAAHIVGCAASTIGRHVLYDPIFAEKVHRAEALAEFELLQRIRKASHWRASAWLLERRNPDLYGPPVPKAKPEATLVLAVKELLASIARSLPRDVMRDALKRLDSMLMGSDPNWVPGNWEDPLADELDDLDQEGYAGPPSKAQQAAASGKPKQSPLDRSHWPPLPPNWSPDLPGAPPAASKPAAEPPAAASQPAQAPASPAETAPQSPQSPKTPPQVPEAPAGSAGPTGPAPMCLAECLHDCTTFDFFSPCDEKDVPCDTDQCDSSEWAICEQGDYCGPCDPMDHDTPVQW